MKTKETKDQDEVCGWLMTRCHFPACRIMDPDVSARYLTAPVVFFDGLCGLCNGFVDFLLARDRRGVFHFSPLQGETFAEWHRKSVTDTGERSKTTTEDPSSIILGEGESAYRKSEAVLRILEGLGGAWTLVRILRAIPLGLRDRLYDLVARNRYRWFQKRATCRLPSPEEQPRFLP